MGYVQFFVVNCNGLVSGIRLYWAGGIGYMAGDDPIVQTIDCISDIKQQLCSITVAITGAIVSQSIRLACNCASFAGFIAQVGFRYLTSLFTDTPQVSLS